MKSIFRAHPHREPYLVVADHGCASGCGKTVVVEYIDRFANVPLSRVSSHAQTLGASICDHCDQPSHADCQNGADYCRVCAAFDDARKQCATRELAVA